MAERKLTDSERRTWERTRSYAVIATRYARSEGRKFGRRATIIAAVATALRTVKRVQIAATSEAEAKRLMDAARELLRHARR